MNENIVALHEAGHIMALVGSGIRDEFTDATVQPMLYEGKPVLGLTRRTGASLLAHNCRIGEQAARPAAYRDYMLEEACRICFPHVCFFCGGAAIEDSLNPNDAGTTKRLQIDRDNLRKLVLPAMGLALVSDEEFDFVRNCGVEAVKGMVEADRPLALHLRDELFRMGSLGAADLEREVSEVQAAPLKAVYDSARTKVGEWYQAAFMRHNAWAATV